MDKAARHDVEDLEDIEEIDEIEEVVAAPSSAPAPATTRRTATRSKPVERPAAQTGPAPARGGKSTAATAVAEPEVDEEALPEAEIDPSRRFRFRRWLRSSSAMII